MVFGPLNLYWNGKKGSKNQCCGSGSGQIRIICRIGSGNRGIPIRNCRIRISINDTLKSYDVDKRDKPMLTGHFCECKKKNLIFLRLENLGYYPHVYRHRVDAVPDPGRVRIRIGIKMEIRIRISIKTMPIHNTVYTYTVCKGGRGYGVIGGERGSDR